jgi:hypothetical protein
MKLLVMKRRYLLIATFANIQVRRLVMIVSSRTCVDLTGTQL